MVTKLISGVLAALSSTLALTSTLTLVNVPASAFEVERGSHGASRIVPQRKSKALPTQAKTETQAPKATTQTVPQRPTLVRGPHGAQRLVNQ